jgi:hypothetical protein
MGIPVGDLSPRGTGMGKKCSPQAFVGIPAGKFFVAGTGMGSYSPAGNSPLPSLFVAIITSVLFDFVSPCMDLLLNHFDAFSTCPI